MKILFIVKSESIQTARWISQINDQGWEIHLFLSTYESDSILEIKNVTIHRSVFPRVGEIDQLIIFKSGRLQLNRIITFFKKIRDKINPNFRATQLKKIIEKIKPDIIHSLGFQSSGYLTLQAKQIFQGKFPIWIASNWNNDIYQFSSSQTEKFEIKKQVKECDYYSCECKRDFSLAKEIGFEGKILPIFLNSDGFNLKEISSWRKPLSQRDIIMIKGEFDLYDRIMVPFDALNFCMPDIKKYKVVIYSISDHSLIAKEAEKFQKNTGVRVKVLSQDISPQQILKLHGKARISIDLSLNDAMSQSFLEALTMGSFPIQSSATCAHEWIKNGETGIIVPPEDSRAIAKAIKRAIQEDKMIKEAIKLNWQTAQKKLDCQLIKQKTLDFYQMVFKNCSTPKLKINWFKRGQNIVIEMFLIIWIIFFMLASLVKFGIQGFQVLRPTGKISSKIEIIVWQANQWLEQHIWRTF